MAKKPTSKATPSDVARRIWLAGIGAYGKAFTDAQESLAKVGDDTSRKFDELVARGEEIEDTIETKRQEVMEKIPAQPFALDDRIQEMRARLGLVIPATETPVADTSPIEERLNRLEEKVDLLIKQVQAMPKRSARNATTKKRSAKKTN